MVFVKENKQNGRVYYDLVESIRVDGKPKHRFITHLGTRKPSEMELIVINLNLKGNDRIMVKKPLLSNEETQKIEALNGGVKNRLNEYSKLEKENWKKRFNIDFIYNTNAIEGSTITRDETELILETKQAIHGKSLREIHEVENMHEAIKFVDGYGGNLSEKFIKGIHAMVQKNIDNETLGEYKRVPNYIGKHYPTHPIFVPKRMQEETAWYRRNKTRFHPFELALIMHLKLVTIHPFTDGNGRAARLVHNFILQNNGFNPMIYSTKTKMQYYMALNLANQGEPRPFVDYTISEYARTYKEH